MAINNEISTYFSGAISGFVANRFVVTISGMGFQNIRFYVKKISLPYETLQFVDDIYVSDVTLARPKNVLSVLTFSELGIVFRMDPENIIIKQLESLFASTHNLTKFEAAANKSLFNISVTVHGADYSVKKSYNYKNCTLYEMSSYDLDSSDRKFKEYDVKFTCNRVATSEYSNSSGSGSGIPTVTNCGTIYAKLKAAYDRFMSECNARKNPAPVNGYRMTEESVISAISASGIFVEYGKAMQGRTKCSRIPTELRLGDDIPYTAQPAILQLSRRAGIPDNEIKFVGFAYP